MTLEARLWRAEGRSLRQLTPSGITLESQLADKLRKQFTVDTVLEVLNR